MSFKDIDIKISYTSVGENKISDIINELLEQAVYYKRSVGFFDSSALNFISEGINGLVANNGYIRLITSPNLSEDDVKAITLGYDMREKLVSSFFVTFDDIAENLSDEKLQYLAYLICKDILDIKIAHKKNGGIYHDKLAILSDNEENKVVFVGSNNETAGGYLLNYEKSRVFKSWQLKDYVDDEEQTFDKIWYNNDINLDTIEFKDALKEKIISIAQRRGISIEIEKKEKYDLYDYQNKAINKWAENNYNGFLVMATGTGKTVTSIYGIKRLLENSTETIFTVIAVPYIHLVSQWYEDVYDILGNKCLIYKVYGEITDWDIKIRNAIFHNKFSPGEKKNIIVISTLTSFYSERFDKLVKLVNTKKLLAVDEAHNFLPKIYDNQHGITNYEYKLGLSATPVFGNDYSKTKDLCDFFGGVVYELPIEKAIGKFLVNYTYTPIYVSTTEEEEKNFENYKRKMMYCIDQKTGVIKDSEGYMKARRAKLRVISDASEKLKGVTKFIDTVNQPDHFIVYCSDGKNQNMRVLNRVVNILNDKGFKPSQFTCEETMKDREMLIDNFDKGYISTLVAIRCLDEGINIKSIKSALILASNDNYREFVQRRGRILRKYPGKTVANIVDIIVLPSLEAKDIAEIELRRYYEYAKLALNKDELLKDLNKHLNTYGLTQEDISFKFDEFEDKEDDLDE